MRPRPREPEHPRRRLHHGAVERRAERAEAALRREHEIRQAEARRSLLSAMVTDLASGFVNAPSDMVDRAILQALQELCHAVGADRARLAAWDAAAVSLRWGQGWSRRGIPDADDRGPVLDLGPLTAWRESASEGRILEIPSVRSLSGDDPLRGLLERWGIGSLLALPLMEEERCTGFLVIETHDRELRWNHDEFGALVVAAELFSNSAMRRQHEAALERALDEARSALRAKDAFLANMSHELRTPLNGIIGMAQLLVGGVLPEAQRDQARTIQQSARNLQQVLDDIVDFARLEAGSSTLEAATVDLRALLDEVVAHFVGTYAPGQVQLRAGLAQDVPRYITTDPTRLRQVLTHLVGNALRHTSTGSVTVQAMATAPPGRLLLEVADTGCGMDATMLGRLFRPFVQADSSHTRRHGGLGLGLAICDRVCRLMGGSIEASAEPGQGSVFTVDLPLVVAEAPLQPVPADPVRVPTHVPGARVLVVEDNQINRMIAAGALERLGCQVDVATDGIEAVRKALAIAYSMIFMDVQMPRMDGIAATRAIRGNEARSDRPRTPIVGLTCLGQPEDRARALAAGMDEYLTKPIDSSQFVHAVATLARRPAAAGGLGTALLFAAATDPDASRLVAALAAVGIAASVTSQVSQGMMRLSRRDPANPDVSLVIILGGLSGMGAPVIVQAVRALPERSQIPILVVGEAPPGVMHCASLASPPDISAICTLAVQDPGSWPTQSKGDTATGAAEPMSRTDPVPRRTDVILVVDDNEVNRRLISLQAARSGCPIETCADGRAAVNRVAAGGIALVLMDCQMPGMDGYEATQEIRRREAGTATHLPIIAVTAHALPENREKCRLAGMDDFLAKPINHDQLLAVIKRRLFADSTVPMDPMPASRQPACDAVLDPEPLRRIEETAPGSAEQIVEVMLEDIRYAQQELPRLLAAGALAQLGKEAHKMKGSSGSIGATELSQACAKLEQQARAGDQAACVTATEALLQALPRLQARLQPFNELKQED